MNETINWSGDLSQLIPASSSLTSSSPPPPTVFHFFVSYVALVLLNRNHDQYMAPKKGSKLKKNIYRERISFQELKECQKCYILLCNHPQIV